MPDTHSSDTSPREGDHSNWRARPPLTEQIQIMRELWLLREQTRVQAAETCFLTELERLLTGRPYSHSEQSTPRPPPPPEAYRASSVTSDSIPHAPPLPPLPPPHAPSLPSAVASLDDGAVFENNPPPRGIHSPAREHPGSFSQGMEQARASQRVTVSYFFSFSFTILLPLYLFAHV